MRRWLRELQDTAHALRLTTELFVDYVRQFPVYLEDWVAEQEFRVYLEAMGHVHVLIQANAVPFEEAMRMVEDRSGKIVARGRLPEDWGQEGDRPPRVPSRIDPLPDTGWVDGSFVDGIPLVDPAKVKGGPNDYQGPPGGAR